MRARPQYVFLILAALAAAPLAADCISHGHYGIVANVSPMIGTRYPYTEDLAFHPDTEPFGDSLTVRYHPDHRWIKIQSGCAERAERNVSASTSVNLMLRASLHLAYMRSEAPPPETRFEVQLRVGTSKDDPDSRIAATEMRRVGMHHPQSFRFGGTLQNVPAGNYVYSLWFRLLDGPETNHVTLGLQWITAQGSPNAYPSLRATSNGDSVASEVWQPAGDALSFDTPSPLDLAIHSSFVITSASGRTLSLGWSLDGAAPGIHAGSIAAPAVLPAGETTFDHEVAVPAGRHSLRLLARTTGGTITMSKVTTEFISFPVQLGTDETLAMEESTVRLRAEETLAMQESIAVEPLVVRTSGSGQPLAMSSECGRWTKLLEFRLEPTAGAPSWMIDGYVEILGADEGGYGQIAVQSVHEEPDPLDPGRTHMAITDMGEFEFQFEPHPGGIFFYGDCSKWGNAGNMISIWIRRVEGCNDTPFGGEIIVGRRWIGIKLLPSRGPYL